jgi:hypothetical protein
VPRRKVRSQGVVSPTVGTLGVLDPEGNCRHLNSRWVEGAALRHLLRGVDPSIQHQIATGRIDVGPAKSRLVIRSIRAWNIDPPADQEHIPEGVEPVDEPITIETLSGIEVLLWTHVKSETMALVCWRHTLYLVKEDDLETRTMRVVRR